MKKSTTPSSWLSMPKKWAQLRTPSDVSYIDGPATLKVRQEVHHIDTGPDAMHAWVLMPVEPNRPISRPWYFPIVARDRRGRRNGKVTGANVASGSYWWRFICNNIDCQAVLLVSAEDVFNAVEDGVPTPGYNPWKDRR